MEMVKMSKEFENKVTSNNMRDMNELEVYGARYAVASIYKDSCESIGMEFFNPDDSFYYSDRRLVCSELVVSCEGSLVMLSDVFCLNGSSVLFGWVYDYNEYNAYEEGNSTEEPVLSLVRLN